jgi:hypothetical protein
MPGIGNWANVDGPSAISPSLAGLLLSANPHLADFHDTSVAIQKTG